MSENNIIVESSENFRIDKYIFSKLKNVSFIYIIKNIRNGKIKLNGRKILPNQKVNKDDIISFDFPISIKSNKPVVAPIKQSTIHLDIKYEDDNIVIVNKPAGLASHSDSKNKDSMLERVQQYYYSLREKPQLCNRLDINTAGLMIFAKTQIAHTEMNKLISNKEVHKYYLCKVYGNFGVESGLLEDYLTILDEEYGVKISEKETKGQSVKIQTAFQTLDIDNKGNSILEINLLTGKKHQIRAHLAFYDHPIFGEQNYISKNKKIPHAHQELYAYKLHFEINDKNSMLYYLNNKTIQLDKKMIIENLQKIR
ncbi:MAG: RluA family pseudouridine synthase [Mycoplasmataceae bacterium]|jgi:RluA family pseudouridine synthase|nr:RluA family pseudouridine synthase [Mycoplasmataceae bacterium]